MLISSALGGRENIMKTPFLTLSWFAAATVFASAQSFQTSQPSSSGTMPNAPATSDYQIKERGANQNIWERTEYEQLPGGEIVPHTHRYTELAHGGK